MERAPARSAHGFHERAPTCGTCRRPAVPAWHDGNVRVSLLEAIVEDQLGLVVFVMDYVQLDFGDACL
jgi:hypothetical protein